jgi:TolB protein
MNLRSMPSRLYCNLTLAILCWAAPALLAQAAQPRQHFRSRLFIYDLRSGASHEVFAADAIWEAPNWSPGGTYLISNSGGVIYKIVLKQDGTAETPQKLAIPEDHRCNNDKAISPDDKMLAFSANVPPQKGSQVFLANADGSGVKLMVSESPSYFHGWSPDNKTLAFVAQRNGSGQFDIYSMPAGGGPEQRLTEDIHHDDGPDYSPDGKWIYINSNRSGKEAIWRFPSTGAGPNDEKAQMVISDSLEDWFPHPSPDGKKLVYIGYPTGTPTHDPRSVQIRIKLVNVDHDTIAPTQKVLVEGTGGQGTFNVNSWAPDSMRFAYVLYEALP